MNWPDGKPYYSLNHYYKKLFGEKTYKLALDIGSTCPNRDGTLSKDGCIYCSERGSGDFASGRSSAITEQIDLAVDLVSQKYDGDTYIAYLQSFTNTYGPTDQLLDHYEAILSDPRIKGLAIGTRPDCLDVCLMDGLLELRKTHPVWIELGLQTIHEDSATFINRCYPLKTFEEAVEALNRRGIPVITHLIAGLPGESQDDFLQSVDYLNTLPISGVKFHMLHIMKDTPLADYYDKHPFDLLDRDLYCQLICQAISRLSPDIVIHRLTGDGPRDLLIEPTWTLNKRSVLNEIHKTFKASQLWQGKMYTPRRQL